MKQITKTIVLEAYSDLPVDDDELNEFINTVMTKIANHEDPSLYPGRFPTLFDCALRGFKVTDFHEWLETQNTDKQNTIKQKVNKYRWVKIPISFVLAFLVVYLFSAFILLNWNPLLWSMNQRIAYVIISIIIYLLFLLFDSGVDYADLI